jgi:hypothetical protein
MIWNVIFNSPIDVHKLLRGICLHIHQTTQNWQKAAYWYLKSNKVIFPFHHALRIPKSQDICYLHTFSLSLSIHSPQSMQQLKPLCRMLTSFQACVCLMSRIIFWFADSSWLWTCNYSNESSSVDFLRVIKKHVPCNQEEKKKSYSHGCYAIRKPQSLLYITSITVVMFVWVWN